MSYINFLDFQGEGRDMDFVHVLDDFRKQIMHALLIQTD